MALRARLVLASALVLALAAPASAQNLHQRIRALVDAASLGDGVSILVADENDRDLYALRPDVPRNPASNMKLVTAAAALLELGPGHQMLTGLYGDVQGGRVANLVLRGYGDPGLRMSDLVELAEQLRDKGVRAVDRVYVDGSYFDDQILPPAFEQQPDEVAAFRAAVGAVAVERASYVLRCLPGPSVGAPAVARLDPPGYFEIDNGMTTSEGGAPGVIASQRALDDGRLQVVLRGTVPAGILGVGYRRRVENPLVHAAHAMAEALDRAGIGGRRAENTKNNFL